MSFTRKFDTIIQKSNTKISKITSDNGLILSNYDLNHNVQSFKTILSGEFSFLDYWFDIDKNDRIYGLVHNKKDSLIYYNFNNKYISRNELLHYNPNCNLIKFVYIKTINNIKNIMYYSIDKMQPANIKLIHLYNTNNTWNTFIIDSFSYNVLTNYVVVYDKNFLPTIFYFKLYKGFEELFTSSFDDKSLKWSEPIQLTNTQKPKIYLSVIYDTKDKYHIVFSENYSNKYYCIYIHGYLKNNTFYTINNWILSDTVACTFPTIIEYNEKIYAEWIEYHNLYVKFSCDYGNTWTQSVISKDSSTSSFCCCNYHSNCTNKNTLNYFTLYMIENSTKIIGI